MIELQKGTTLIEASAGTGKTYTLCRIALKLIVRDGILLDRILIVTFTQAATFELKTRIRQLLVESLEALRDGRVDEPELLAALELGATPALLIERIRSSLDLFDEATISTIHGFCRRALEFAILESGLALDADLQNVETALIEKLQKEFVRQRVIEVSPVLSAHLRSDRKFIALLHTVGRETASHPFATLLPEDDVADVDSVEDAYSRVMEALPQLEKESRSWRERIKGNCKKLIAVLSQEELAAIARREIPLPDDLAALELLTTDSFRKALKKVHASEPLPAVAERVDSLKSLLRRARFGLAREYRPWLFGRLATLKERENAVSFNDLLHLLRNALRGPDGGRLREAVGSLYDAALVDEFQDTDPVQYDILSQLFGDSSSYLVYIGDPKQAIYRFRGADIFAYFRATRESNHRLTLSTNFRSAPALVDGVNQLFDASTESFAHEAIVFQPASSSDQLESGDAAGLQFLFAKPDENAPNDLASVRQALSGLAVVAARQFIGNRDPTQDVAFLVSTNYEADLLASALRVQGFDALIMGERSIFQTEASPFLLLLLAAIQRPSSHGLVRGLLLSRPIGFSWQTIDGSTGREAQSSVSIQLNQLKRNWKEASIGAEVQRLLETTNGLDRLLSQSDGERLFTNIVHLAELLDSAKSSLRLGPIGLAAWLQKMGHEDVSTSEEWQTRLPSQENKAKILTIHKSKGLEFEVVICPFLSLLRLKPTGDAIAYHNPKDNGQYVIDLDPSLNVTGQQAALDEAFAEQIRLIYVALTRARQTCLALWWSEEQQAAPRQPSALARMLLGRANAQSSLKNDELTDTLRQRLSELGAIEAKYLELIPASIDDGGKTPSLGDAPPLKPRPFTIQRIPEASRALSFSSITRSIHQLSAEDSLEEDASTEPELQPAVRIETSHGSLLDLPPGTETGDFIHRIFEQIDFQDPASVAQNVEEAQERLLYGRTGLMPTVVRSIGSLLTKPIDLPDGRLRLADIAPPQRLVEAEFAYPTEPTSVRRILKKIIATQDSRIPDSWARKITSSDFQFTSEAVRGFIDLVFRWKGRFYIIDWKSNYLGSDATDYCPQGLASAMEQHDYYLQYLLYTIALKRYLALRLPQENFAEAFGGVLYLFVRGMTFPGNAGVYFDRPAPAFIDRLERELPA